MISFFFHVLFVIYSFCCFLDFFTIYNQNVKLELKQLKQTGTKTRAENCHSKDLEGNSPFHMQPCGAGQNKQSILSELLWKDHAEYEMK